ncbi:hypothetical protein P3G55_25530, partial [Leptospira sp. 96542]|nr:hypothetical protein [Leptospira sp. 96542]
CAWMHSKAMRAVATPSLALAVIGDRLLTGKAVLYTDRSATIELSNETDPALDCMGTMNYTNSTGGVLDLRCNDGSQIRLPYTALSQTAGHASGGGVSLTYGLPPTNARAWLTPPQGRRLVVQNDTSSFQCKWFKWVVSCDSLQLQ